MRAAVRNPSRHLASRYSLCGCHCCISTADADKACQFVGAVQLLHSSDLCVCSTLASIFERWTASRPIILFDEPTSIYFSVSLPKHIFSPQPASTCPFSKPRLSKPTNTHPRSILHVCKDMFFVLQDVSAELVAYPDVSAVIQEINDYRTSRANINVTFTTLERRLKLDPWLPLVTTVSPSKVTPCCSILVELRQSLMFCLVVS